MPLVCKDEIGGGACYITVYDTDGRNITGIIFGGLCRTPDGATVGVMVGITGMVGGFTCCGFAGVFTQLSAVGGRMVGGMYGGKVITVSGG